MKNGNVRALTEGAVMVALASILSVIKLFELPQGGAISIGMLPLFVYCNRWGWKRGFNTCFAYALTQLLLDSGFTWGLTSILLDYIAAFGILGVAGFFAGKKHGLYLGTAAGCFGRFVVHFISGVTLYRIYAPTEFFSISFLNPYVYSAVYNGSIILIDMIICLVILRLLKKPLDLYLEKNR